MESEIFGTLRDGQSGLYPQPGTSLFLIQNLFCSILQILKKPITGSVGLETLRILPFSSEGCGSNTEPVTSVFFFIFSRNSYPSFVQVYCFTLMLYKTPSFQDFGGIKVSGR